MCAAKARFRDSAACFRGKRIVVLDSTLDSGVARKPALPLAQRPFVEAGEDWQHPSVSNSSGLEHERRCEVQHDGAAPHVGPHVGPVREVEMHDAGDVHLADRQPEFFSEVR